ncbi:MAG: MBL fold metallo-hydrolase [Ruminococcus sp.]|nr:MBL fold metallo-hydrolase [Ruminococcus sp.]
MASRRQYKRRYNKKGSLISTVIVIIVCIIWVLVERGCDSTKKATPKPQALDNTDTQVYFVDVGQGDATLVTSDGHNMLIDTGERDDKNTLIHFLEEHDIQSLDYLIISHPHTDHMGEASDILKQFDTKTIIMPRTGSNIPTNSTYKYYLQTVKKLNKRITAATDTQLSLGKMTVNLFTSKKQHEDLNNYSVLVKLTHGENSFLITGDCEVEEEAEMVEHGFDLSADVLRAGHHGSYKSSYNFFLEEVNPSYAVISCGKDNMYGHPHEQAVQRLKSFADHYYCTMTDGTITFSSDGKGLTVNTEK